MNTTAFNPTAATKAVTVVGAGNIGSHLLPLVARMPDVGSVTVVDHDSYEERNLVSQSIAPGDVGRPKADCQAERLRALNPRLSVTPIVARLESIPWGILRADVIAGCLDSRFARRMLSRAAFRLGVPLADAAVQQDGNLARIRVYRPSGVGACFECSWDERDYELERETFACDGTPRATAPTNASAALGALAAAMLGVEIEKILGGEWQRVAVAHEVLLDANSHRHFVTRLPRNPACRFDHRTFKAEPLRGAIESLTLADLFATGARELRMDGRAFARHWACGICGRGLERLGLRDRITVTCPKCGHSMRAVGFHTLDGLLREVVSDSLLATPVADVGFRTGDIFTAVRADGEAHFEITMPSQP
jgi:molybdopterin/thiamine biosynthesis adenylyltransferase